MPLPLRAGLYDSILPLVKTQVASQIKGALALASQIREPGGSELALTRRALLPAQSAIFRAAR